VPGTPATLFLRIIPEESGIQVVAYTDGEVEEWPPERLEESLTAKILDALTDGVTFERVGTSPAVRILKLTTPGS
jgi:hypothetical protein